MHTEIHDALTLLVWAQQNPDGCVAYRLIRSDGETSITYVEHPMCAVRYTADQLSSNVIAWPMSAYTGAGEADDAGEPIEGHCSECRKTLYPEY